MTIKHTPGPWRVADNMHGINNVPVHGVVDKQGMAIANCGNGSDSSINARMIAAAPELLDALLKTVRYLADLNGCDWIKGDDVGAVDMRQRAKALQQITFSAIAKATGGAS